MNFVKMEIRGTLLSVPLKILKYQHYSLTQLLIKIQ